MSPAYTACPLANAHARRQRLPLSDMKGGPTDWLLGARPPQGAFLIYEESFAPGIMSKFSF